LAVPSVLRRHWLTQRNTDSTHAHVIKQAPRAGVHHSDLEPGPRHADHRVFLMAEHMLGSTSVSAER
jgi:hypothetical protein